MPLLVSSGNGRGGGDFEGDQTYVGIWAGDVISVEENKPLGYTEIIPTYGEKPVEIISYRRTRTNLSPPLYM